MTARTTEDETHARGPRVTILLTVYKRTDFLPEALESALGQTFRDFEIIVADDSGTAAASGLCQAYAAAGRLTYIANPQTLGIVGSIQGALEKARAPYVAILNDDDAWEPEFLAALVPALEEDPRRVLAFCDHWIMRENGDVDPEETERNTTRYGRSALTLGDVPDPAGLVLIQNGVPLAMGSVFRRDALALVGLPKEVSGAYDLWISCALASLRRPFHYTPTRLSRYRVHSRAETARRSHDRCANLVFIFAELLRRTWFPEHTGYLRLRLAAAQFHLGRDKLFFNRVNEARDCFRSARRLQGGWKPLAALMLSYLPRRIRGALKLSTLTS